MPPAAPVTSTRLPPKSCAIPGLPFPVDIVQRLNIPSAAMADRPNVLLVVTDQQHPDLIGAAGRLPLRPPAQGPPRAPAQRPPALAAGGGGSPAAPPAEDRLCAEGMRLTRAYAASPLCAPSRMSIVSGQYPSRHGVWTNGIFARDDMLSLPRLLGEQA